ncbi:MAG: NAD(+)/NADH kinase [Actinobacteria bacterium]|nr:NAD(+)/NADH kinase [Actinomycetota bacterium]
MSKADGFKDVLIIPHARKPGNKEMFMRVSSWLDLNNVKYSLLRSDAEALETGSRCNVIQEVSPSIDLAITLGGDGTMLHAIDILWGTDIPVAGINIGKLGFLTAGEVHQAKEVLVQLFSGKYKVSERVPVGCSLGTDGSHGRYRALNEIVIGKLARERLIHLNTYINGDFFMRYSGDGLIISSATGSTAYSLSAGGPIVTPELRCFMLTPICAHMLFSRPMVLHPEDRVTVIVEEEPETLALSIDGREEVEVPYGEIIEFYLLENRIKILELKDVTFYKTVRRKFLSPP